MTPSEAAATARAALRARGLPPGLTSLDPNRQSAQAHLFRAGDLMLKVYAPEARDRAARQSDRQADLAAQLAQGPFRVPPVTFFDPGGVLAMPALDAPDLATRLRRGDDAIKIAGQAGGWLKALHALTLRPAPFRPRGHVNWLDRLIDAGQQGVRVIPDLSGFAAAARETENRARAARGLPATRAVTHRDMTLANLVTDQQACWGLDVENAREDEPLRDLFTLALDLATLGDTDPAPSLAALATTYGDRVTAPEVRAVLARCFSLWVWANTPERPSRRQTARLAVARAVLAGETHLI